MKKNYNQSKIPKILVIVGPTASGKSDLAVKLARKFNGEIISGDSRQVYQGMDIGTGKITKEEMRDIPHHLLDVATPQQNFNVSHFKKMAEKKIEVIRKRGKLPMIVGGTGFWIDALLYNFNLPQVKSDSSLRRKLEKLPAQKLFEKLAKLDPARATTIDRHNPRRLIRALEIVLATGQPIPPLQKQSRYDALILGIKKNPQELEKKIYKRLLKRLKQGLVKEVKKLHRQGVSWKRLDAFGLEYRYLSRYLQGSLNHNQMVEKLYLEIKKYAKRQMTWFKKDQHIKWIKSYAKANALVKKFLQ